MDDCFGRTLIGPTTDVSTPLPEPVADEKQQEKEKTCLYSIASRVSHDLLTDFVYRVRSVPVRARDMESSAACDSKYSLAKLLIDR